MIAVVRHFYARARPHLGKDGDLPDFFVYFITAVQGEVAASTKSIGYCYDACDLAAPNWLASHLSKGLKSKPKLFVKRDGGYRLENQRRQEIANLLGEEQPALEITTALAKLEQKIPEGAKRDFLHETIACFGVGAYRAAVIMCWNLCVHHLQDYILADTTRLAAFDAVLAANKDGRVKIKSVAKPDDFTEMSESKFLLFCRESKLITSTIFKKLENRLDERNGAAHPSGVKTTPKAAEAYIEDLIENVLVKFST